MCVCVWQTAILMVCVLVVLIDSQIRRHARLTCRKSSPDEVACRKFHSIRELEGNKGGKTNQLKASKSQSINLLFHRNTFYLNLVLQQGSCIMLDTICQRASIGVSVSSLTLRTSRFFNSSLNTLNASYQCQYDRLRRLAWANGQAIDAISRNRAL